MFLDQAATPLTVGELVSRAHKTGSLPLNRQDGCCSDALYSTRRQSCAYDHVAIGDRTAAVTVPRRGSDCKLQRTGES
jgi:hypothetical protein